MSYFASYTQQPAERLDYDIPVELATGDDLTTTPALTTVAVTPVTVPPLDVDAVISGSTVKLWADGGLNGTTYKAEVTIKTKQERTKQIEIRFKIKEN